MDILTAVATPSSPLAAAASGNAASAAPAPVLLVPAAPAPPTDASDIGGLLRRLRRDGAIAIAAWLLLFALWAGLAPISGAVVGSGLVKVEANRLTVTHRDGGNVAKVLVREGEIVRRGPTLIVLEDMRVDSSVDLLDVQLAAERLRQSRLETEAALRPVWTPPVLPENAVSALRVGDALARERSAFDARRRTLQSQLDSVRSQIFDAETEMKAHERDSVAAAEALRLLKEELASNEQLLQENFVNRTRVLTLRRGVAEYESRIGASHAEQAQARQKRSELEGRLATVKDAYVQQATEDLREASAKIVDIEERLRAGRDTATRQVVVAPTDGRLVGLKVNTVGSAIGPREPIVDIVPSDVPLVVEARVSAQSISDIVPGQQADVKLLAYSQRSGGMLDATVVNVSADALEEERSGTPYFAVQVEVSPEALKRADHGPLLPGMAAEVYIKTHERTALQFLMDPLTAAMRRSFREH